MAFKVDMTWKRCDVCLMEELRAQGGYKEAYFEFYGDSGKLLATYELAPCSYTLVREALDSVRAAGFEQTDIIGIQQLTNISLARIKEAA